MTKNNWTRWLMISGLAGAVGAGLLYANGNANMRRMRHNAANAATKIARDAGNMVSDLGEQIANKMH